MRQPPKTRSSATSLPHSSVVIAYAGYIMDIHDTLGSLWEKVVTAMQKPYPILRSLTFHVLDQVLSLPDTFLDGTAPCLQALDSGMSHFGRCHDSSRLQATSHLFVL
jgi:hypothetical protein